MKRALLAALMSVLLFGVTSPGSQADGPQLEDPAGDHPVPWVDLTGVQLKLGPGTVRTGPVLDLTFIAAGDITPENRTMMTGYNFAATIGPCKFDANFNTFPGATDSVAGVGGPTVLCEGGKSLSPPFKIAANTISISISLQDLKGVAAGVTVSDMTAWTIPLQGFSGADETGILAMTGDTAASDKKFALS